ncbi:hypothetical protein [Streptosporangium sp. NPDC000396]|uniref:hypothetical protein n=1 Tax=Streptosporangium sp. NPDC000396 TaxID=3366185 RepID=UPI0036AF6709
MKHRILAVLLFLAATLAIAPGTACACSCARLEPKAQVGQSAAVFTGTVVAVRQVEGTLSGPRPPMVYTFRVDQVYKGKASVEFDVATNADGASCGYDFDTGSRYLVFASEGESGTFEIDPGVPLRTTLCSGNRRVQAGEAPLRMGDGVQNAEPLTAELLAALGTATRPTAVAKPSPPDAAGDGPSPFWIYGGAAVAALGLALAGWRLLRRRRV